MESNRDEGLKNVPASPGSTPESGAGTENVGVTRRQLIKKTLIATGGVYAAIKVVETFTGHPILGVMPAYATSGRRKPPKNDNPRGDNGKPPKDDYPKGDVGKPPNDDSPKGGGGSNDRGDIDDDDDGDYYQPPPKKDKPPVSKGGDKDDDDDGDLYRPPKPPKPPKGK